MKSRNRPIQFEKGLLNRVLGILPVAHDMERDALQPRAVGLVELLERTNILPPARRQQIGFGGVFRGLHLVKQRQSDCPHHSLRFPFALWTGGVAETLENVGSRHSCSCSQAVCLYY